jgi:hypothetical protein
LQAADRVNNGLFDAPIACILLCGSLLTVLSEVGDAELQEFVQKIWFFGFFVRFVGA